MASIVAAAKSFPINYWEYFLTIEGDLLTAARWVEFREENMAVFSVAFSRMLLAAGSECEVIGKAICRELNPNRVPEYLSDCRPVLMEHAQLQSLPRQCVSITRYSLTFRPWASWGAANPPMPAWWTAYNKVKHEGHDKYNQATLANVLEATAGLYCLAVRQFVLVTGKDPSAMHPAPQLFSLADCDAV